MLHLPMFPFKMGKKKKQQKCDEQIFMKIKMLQDHLKATQGRIQSTPSENELFRSLLQLLDKSFCVPECPKSKTKVKNDEERLCLLSPHYTIVPGCSLCPSSINLLPERFVLPLPSVDATTQFSIEPPRTFAIIEELDENIMELHDDAPKTKSPLGPRVHKDIATRWQDILTIGLEKDYKDKLLKSYQVPCNCNLLLAPALNPEVKALLHETIVKRDSTLMLRQNQLGVALSALAAATDMILTNETCMQKILKPISDACRILCDIHYSETKMRRKIVLSSINTELRDSLLKTKRSRLLFGVNMLDQCKTPKYTAPPGDCFKFPLKPMIRNRTNTQSGLNRASMSSMPQEVRPPFSPIQRTLHRHSRCSLPPRSTLLRR